MHIFQRCTCPVCVPRQAASGDADAFLQDTVAWLVGKDVVRALLRAHLHQRQYVDQVRCSGLDARHM